MTLYLACIALVAAYLGLKLLQEAGREKAYGLAAGPGFTGILLIGFACWLAVVIIVRLVK